MAHPTRFERVAFAFGGLTRWHYAASFGIGLSTNRKNRVLRVRDLNLWRTAGLPNWASDAYEVRWSITHWTKAAAIVLPENAATKSQRIR